MLSLEEIKPYYPQKLQQFDRFILREYLQYKILEIIFDSPFASKLSFLGGTCLRIVHGNKRFSEDLDFDNFNLSMKDFKEITAIVQKELEQLGYGVEMRNIEKGAYHCYIRFPGILYAEGLSNHREEKILIQLDTEPHHYKYQPEQPMLNKFDVFTQINATPVNILLAQKFYAVINRKRNKGRDFFDIVFLLGLGATSDYEYLSAKLEIDNADALRQRILDKCAQIDMKAMASDVEPFLFEPKDEKKVLLFPEYMEQVKL
ncbi:MAG: nucleotidyl transferase AbiEii/AbiGii toxin family protein [Chitinophagales bacterium]